MDPISVLIWGMMPYKAMTNYSYHYPSIHCRKLTCIKEAAKAQNSGQADIVK